ncbi:MAG: hypothetical protein ACLQLG_11450 [Thermoguttaceae bacterium]
MNYLSHGIVAAGLLCLAGCGPSADEEANIKDFLKTAQEMNQVMNTVRDDKTAERAGPRFNEVAGRMLSLLGRAQGFSKAHRTKLAEEYHEELDAAQKDFGDQIFRLLATPGGPEMMAKCKRVLDAWNSTYKNQPW